MSEGSKCSSCGKENPAGAKFCSGCANSLTGNAKPSIGGTEHRPPPPQPNFNRPGIGGMLGQTGGKVEQREVKGTPEAIFAAVASFIEKRENSTIRSQFPPSQISGSVAFKDFMSTLNSWVKTDCEINITPIEADACSVSVGSKVDYSSTMNLWVFSLVMLVVLIFFFNPFGSMTMVYLIIFAAGSVLQIFLLNSNGPKKVSEDLFAHLASAEAVSGVSVEAGATSTPTSAHEPTETAAPNTQESVENDPRTRIKKLQELKDEGLITDDEYEARRAEILQGI